MYIYSNIKWPDGITEEQKEEFIHNLEMMAEEAAHISVIYTPSCGCPIEQFYVLDRFPMSPKIMSQCPECKKGCLMEISDPIMFYEPLSKKDFSLKDLSEGHIPPSRQHPYMVAYKELYEKQTKKKRNKPAF